MSKLAVPLLLIVMLTACNRSESTVSIETVESLAADPARLKELREQCKTDRAKLGDALCNTVAEATRRRFIGDGKVPYTPPKESPKF